MSRLFATSTTPRIRLGFEKCKREYLLEWYIETVKRQIRGVELAGGEAEVLVAINEEEGEEKGKIAGFAVWSWSVKVRWFYLSNLMRRRNQEKREAKGVANRHLYSLPKRRKALNRRKERTSLCVRRSGKDCKSWANRTGQRDLTLVRLSFPS